MVNENGATKEGEWKNGQFRCIRNGGAGGKGKGGAPVAGDAGAPVDVNVNRVQCSLGEIASVIASIKGGSRRSNGENFGLGERTMRNNTSFATAKKALDTPLLPARKSRSRGGVGDISSLQDLKIALNNTPHLEDETALLADRLQSVSKDRDENTNAGRHQRRPSVGRSGGNADPIGYGRERSFDSLRSRGSYRTANTAVDPLPAISSPRDGLAEVIEAWDLWRSTASLERGSQNLGDR